VPSFLTRHRRLLERGWILVSTAYGGLRIFVADHTIARYGVNIWAFATVELTSSLFYGVGTARVVGALIDRRMRAALPWAGVAAVGFASPETFVLLTGNDMPVTVYLALVSLLAMFGTIGMLSLVRRVRVGRARRLIETRALDGPVEGPAGVAVTPP
jgi:hypothetical protein